MKAKRFLDISHKIETRETGDGKRYIEGMIPYGSRSEDLGGFVEIIDRSAFRKTLADGADVFAFWAHNDAEVLASRSAGTLTLDNRDEGLYFSIEMRDGAISEDRWQAVQRGDVSGTSFGFMAERDEWDQAQKPVIRTLKEVRLLEISPGVAFPAYSGAQSGAALRSVVAEARSMSIPAPASPEPIPAPPVQAPEDETRAAVLADAKKELALLGIIAP
jgi:uncharacterized protein